jgi:hypothetical protein
VVHALQDAHLDPDDLMEEPLTGNGDAALAALKAAPPPDPPPGPN